MQVRSTTLSEEIATVRHAVETRVATFSPIENQELEESILSALLRYADDKKNLRGEARDRILAQIRQSTYMGAPVPVSLVIAHGLRAPSPLKFQDPFGPPTYAWLHNLAAMLFVARRVAAVYAPGVRFFIFEEGHLFHEILMVPKEIVCRNLAAFEQMRTAVGAPVVSINLMPNHLPEEEARRLEVTVSDAEVFAFICSTVWMNDPKVMDCMYRTRDKPFEALKRLLGPEVWDEAYERARLKNQILALRRVNGLLPDLIREEDGDDVRGRLIDAAITSKPERLVFRPTGGALFNHGAAVLDQERFVCHILPEYRLSPEHDLSGNELRIGNRHLTLQRVAIDGRELGIEHPEFTWRYETV